MESISTRYCVSVEGPNSARVTAPRILTTQWLIVRRSIIEQLSTEVLQ